MKRDDDLIRDLLLRYEKDLDYLFFMPGETLGSDAEERRERYHVLLMMDVGFAARVGNGTFRLTSQAHDYLDAIRSDTVWNKTKMGAERIGGATIGVMKDIAIAYMKQEAAEKLGIQL